MNMGKTLAVSAGVLVGATVSASAALLDFTDSSTGFASGSIGGVNYVVSASSGDTPNRDQLFDGTATPGEPLAFELDGIGITDDEITTNGHVEELIVQFDQVVQINKLYFLDLFTDGGADAEVAHVSSLLSGSADLNFGGEEAYTVDGAGFRIATPDDVFVGQTFSFKAQFGNDAQGDPDYSLAGIDFTVAPVPVPAAGLLLLGGLGALGAMKRRKS